MHKRLTIIEQYFVQFGISSVFCTDQLEDYMCENSKIKSLCHFYLLGISIAASVSRLFEIWKVADISKTVTRSQEKGHDGKKAVSRNY